MKSRHVLLVAAVCVFGSIEAQSAPVVMATLAAPEAGQRILVVAPHIDDEALAAGGYVRDALDAGADVAIAYVTVGDHSRTAVAANRLTFFATAPMNRKGERRLAEGYRAARSAGIDRDNIFVLGYPDRGLRRMMHRPDRIVRSASTGKRAVAYSGAVSPGAPHRYQNAMSDLEHVLRAFEPHVVIAPSVRDRHPDHRVTALMVAEALGAVDLEISLLSYIIHSARPAAVRLRDADGTRWVAYPLSEATARRKREMLAEYRSQHRSPYLLMLFSALSGRTELFLHSVE